MFKLILLAVMAVAAYAQTSDVAATFMALSSRTGATTNKLTIQQSPDTPAYMQGVRAVIVSTTAGTCQTEQRGTTPTTTAVTIQQTNGSVQFSKLAAYGNSNVGAGSATSPVYPLVQVGSTYQLNLDMTASGFIGPGTTKNVTVSCTIASGDIQIAMYWREQS